MKKIFLSLFLGLFLLSDVALLAQSKIEYPSSFATSKVAYYSTAMTDSTGNHYSSVIQTQGYIPQNVSTYPIPTFYSATGTADSTQIFIQGRSVHGDGTVSVWSIIDTVTAGTNTTSGTALASSSITFNGFYPDQIRFFVHGASTVNRSDVVVKVWSYFVKQ